MEKDLELDNWLMRTGINGDYDTTDDTTDGTTDDTDNDTDNTITLNVTETRFRIPTNYIESDLTHVTWGQETLRRTHGLNHRYERDISQYLSLDSNRDMDDVDGFRYVCYRIRDYITYQSNSPYDIRRFLETALNQGYITNYEISIITETRNIRIIIEKSDLRYSFEIPYLQVRSLYYSD